MKKLIFSTSNSVKFRLADSTCKGYGIQLLQHRLEIDEIQGEDSEKITRDKANKAYLRLKEPVVVSDDSWEFMGLKGFPGAYMSSINNWFNPDDFLHLTLPLVDRRAFLLQMLVYQDEMGQKVFKSKNEGEILKEIRGTSKHANHTIITMQGDKGLSLAEVYENDKDHSKRMVSQVWHKFSQWYETYAV